MAKVYLKFNMVVIKEIELSKADLTFGRKSDNDIVIDNQAVSGHHGKLVRDGDKYFVEDLKSTNGTYLNGHRIERALLKNGDNIGIARHVLEFKLDENELGIKPIDKMIEALDDGEETKIHAKPLGATPPPSPLTPEKMDEIAQEKELGDGTEKKPELPPGIIRILAGAVNNQDEIALGNHVTYIGTGDQAAIKIKGLLAPAIAAAISRRPDGYWLKAAKPGYPKVNGVTVQEQIHLENGALIETGGTNMVFYMGDNKKSTDAKEKGQG